MENSEFDFDAELKKLQDASMGAVQIGTLLSNVYKALRKEGIEAEIAVGIVGTAFGYMMRMPVDGEGADSG